MNAETRLRIGRRVLLSEGIVMGVFGGAGLAWSMANPQFGAAGAPILWLQVTPLHCGVLLLIGVLTIFASLGRAALTFSRIAAITWLVLMIVCLSATHRHVPGPMGFDVRDTVLYGVLGLLNLALVLWFTVAVKRTGTFEDASPLNVAPGNHGHKYPDTVATH